MKFSFNYFICLSICLMSYAQIGAQNASDIKGLAIYHIYANKWDLEGIPEVMKEKINEFVKTDGVVEIHVPFSSGRSLSYPILPKESAMNSYGLDIEVIAARGNGIFCFDWPSKRIINQTTFDDKLYLVEKSSADIEWQLDDGDPEIVNGQLCSKARLYKIRNNILVNDTLVTTVWYSESLAIPVGPSEFVGLPGLIVKIEEKRRTILLSSIVFNNTTEDKVDCPTEGQPIQADDFHTLTERQNNLLLHEMKARQKQYGIKN